MPSDLEDGGAAGHSTAPSAKFFDGFASAFDTLYDQKRGPLMRWVDQRYRSDMFIRFRLTFEVFGDLHDKTVADIGCGSGPYVIEAFRRGAAQVIAVDPAPGMLSLLRQRLADSGSHRQCTILEGAFPQILPPVCDHVMVMGVLDYVVDPLAFLTALRQITGISAAVSFPSKHWFRTPFRKFRYWARRCPVYFYDEKCIEELCRACNFSGLQIRKIPGAGQDYHVCLSV
jgi:cyclopropane fatty-acyl-phospholipid synthase-like methyltransferase